MSAPEEVEYKGIIFRRYPDSPNWADRNYYRPGGGHIINGVAALHREIWMDNYGPIPSGYHIHHLDNNPLNNEIENLACVSGDDHQSLHGDKTKTPEYIESRGILLDRIRPLAAEWHKSDEGRAWHRASAQQMHEKYSGRTVVKECAYCGKEFEAKYLFASRSVYCSNGCKSSARRKSGIDNETRVCAYCGDEFSSNKYSKTKFCSGSCGARFWRSQKRASIQPDGE